MPYLCINKSKTMFKFAKFFIGAAITLFVILICLRFFFVYSSITSGEKIYQIDVNSFNGPESYITKEYQKDAQGCLTFKDEFNFQHTVCNSYTITQY